MVRYYPKNKITPNLYSDGSNLSLNGSPYYGYYYETYDGKFYSGINPQKGSNLQLIPINTITSQDTFKNNLTDSNVKRPHFTFNELTTEQVQAGFDFSNKFVPHYPKPLQSDYIKGYFIRYFSKTVGHNDSIIEISKTQFDNFELNNNDKQSILQYQVISLFWQISGPLYAKADHAGIIDTNKRLVNNKEPQFSGLKNYIGDQYDKYSIPTN